jgi:DNA polymerase III delta prime subunit
LYKYNKNINEYEYNKISMSINKFIPFVEKYRPTNFDDVVLDDTNKIILNNIIETSYFPNLIFYGFPGCGKTTAIINLIKAYQIKHSQQHKELIIHLNASDDRGIDIIRTQILNFVSSNSLFLNGMKFVILDECDYMTKNAQQALKHLLQNYYKNVRFCLICNYISKIDESLKNEFLCLRFNQLNKNDIITFLNKINVSEKLNMKIETLCLIQKKFVYDIRSMINFIQSKINETINIDEVFIDEKIFEELYKKIIELSKITNDKNNKKVNKGLFEINMYIEKISLKLNVNKKSILNDFINYLLTSYYENSCENSCENTCENSCKIDIIHSDFLNIINNTIHINECKYVYNINYFILSFIEFLQMINKK